MPVEISCSFPNCDARASASGPLQATGRRAVLIFADARALDLKRRRLSENFGVLFHNPSSAAKLAPDADHHLFTTRSLLHQLARGGTSLVPGSMTIHLQQGTTFAEKLEAAVETIATFGYEEVVIVGADCPQLDADDVATAFAQLSQHALVLGPDQRGGCYLIGLRLEDRARLHDVCWQRDTDCQQLAARFGLARTFLLPEKLDLDTLADIRLLARCVGHYAALAHELLSTLAAKLRLVARPIHFVRALHRQRARWQLPPPQAGWL